MIKLAIVLGVLFAIGGWAALGQGLDVIWTVFKGFFPILFDVAKSSIEDYLTSPYFIVGVIMSIASAFGIWIGARAGKLLYLIVFIITEILSLASIIANIV